MRHTKPRRNWPAILVATALILAGVGFIAYPYATDARYAIAQWMLRHGVSAEPATATEAGGQAMPDGAVARIIIDAIGIDAYVVEGTDPDALAQGPGHYPATPLPGESGNVGIAGHRTMYGSVFNELNLLSIGDEIVTHTSFATTTYRVVDIFVVDPSQVDVVAPTDDSRLTLTTCHPIGSAAQRLVVVAELAG